MENKYLEQVDQKSTLLGPNNRIVKFGTNDQFPGLSGELFNIIEGRNFVCLCIKEDDGDYLASLIAINSSAGELRAEIPIKGLYHPNVTVELIPRIDKAGIRSYLDANYSGPNLARKFEESIERLQNHKNPIRNRNRRILLIFAYNVDSNSYKLDVLYANKDVLYANKDDKKGLYDITRNTQFRTNNTIC